MKPIFYAYMIAVLVFSACSSGKTTFERGNYYEAVITSVNRLRRNSDHKKSVETLRQAYPMSVAFYEERAKTSLASSEPFKWTEVVNTYTTINVMHDEIKRCPGALAVIPNPVNYYGKLQEAKQNAAEEHYAAGIVALQFGDRESAKKAYRLFQKSNEFVPGYKEVTSYLEAALAAATVKILVEPIPVHSKSVGVSADFFNDKISEFVHSAPINEFVRFYTRVEAQKIKLNADHIIQLQFDDFAVGQVYKHEKEIQLTKDSVELGTYVTASTGNQQNVNSNTPPGGGRLVTTGNPVIATTQNPVNTNQNSNADAERAERERLERERVARELAEKQRLEKQQAEKALAEKLRIEREAAERQRLAKEAAEKAQAERDLAEKQRLERERLEKEQAEKALAEKTRAESAAAENERLARQAAEKLDADRALAEKQRLERERLEKEQAAKAAEEKLKAEREAAEKERIAKEAADRELAEKQRIEKERLEREQAEKASAEKAKADREKAEKDKAEKAKYVDPSINREDTLDVKDPVTICHIPPGNKTNTRTLVINRAALKAHLAHGDSEGDCGGENREEKGKPEDKNKEGDKKDKGPDKKGTGKLDGKKNEHVMLYPANEIIIASAATDAEKFLRYFEIASPAVEGDTNKVYGTVKATLYQFTKTTTSKGIVSFRIINAKTGALLTAEKLPGEFVWVSEWATFNGDERALSPDQLKLTKLREQPAPAAQDLFIEFTKPIYDQITAKIREFYKNY
ncbi:MAG: cell envelope integrity protein TolA [Cyclobacteriaceae bacterium]